MHKKFLHIKKKGVFFATFDLPKTLEIVLGISSTSVNKQQGLGTRLLQANDSIACQDFKIIQNDCFNLLLKPLSHRALSLYALETAAFPDFAPAANHHLPAFYASSLSHGPCITASPTSAPPSPNTTLFVDIISFVLFFLYTPASRGTFTLRMQK